MEIVLRNTGEVKVYVHPDIFIPKYLVRKNGEAKYGGLPKAKEEFEAMGAIFVQKDEKTMDLGEGIYLIGPISRVKPSDDLCMPDRYIKVDNELYPDPFTDEQVLVIDTSKGLLLVLGCTHNGLENTINGINEAMNNKKIFGIIGGMHLCDTVPERILELGLWLKELQVELLICGHCTGFAAAVLLHKSLGNKVAFNYAGKRIITP